ncbi:dTMP kinase [Alteribacter natronophilus]|uniref:dTMP kinase n=1 Tax=Alteribacter natronophilus TaxID=2583810 RepID=UPI00110D63AC|nr:dTMP kinase [Alteribacter natronophilus]TMW69977.1 dTMP kinase [Alteribacter natronophilus]
MKGRFITFEGGEGAGKTTVLRAIQKKLENAGYQVLTTREPGGSVIAEKIRDVILDTRHTEMDNRTEALLYAAARRQHLVEKVLPALEEGAVVLCDRFIDSSIVYQGVARGIGTDEVREMNLFATAGLMPDLTLFFDVDPETGLSRIGKNEGREINRLDQEDLAFHYRVQEAYRSLASAEPERILTVDAGKTEEEVEKEAHGMIISYLKGRA